MSSMLIIDGDNMNIKNHISVRVRAGTPNGTRSLYFLAVDVESAVEKSRAMGYWNLYGKEISFSEIPTRPIDYGETVDDMCRIIATPQLRHPPYIKEALEWAEKHEKRKDSLSNGFYIGQSRY